MKDWITAGEASETYDLSWDAIKQLGRRDRVRRKVDRNRSSKRLLYLYSRIDIEKFLAVEEAKDEIENSAGRWIWSTIAVERFALPGLKSWETQKCIWLKGRCLQVVRVRVRPTAGSRRTHVRHYYLENELKAIAAAKQAAGQHGDEAWIDRFEVKDRYGWGRWKLSELVRRHKVRSRRVKSITGRKTVTVLLYAEKDLLAERAREERNDEFISLSEAAALIGVGQNTVRRHLHRIPMPVDLGNGFKRQSMYRRADAIELAKHRAQGQHRDGVHREQHGDWYEQGVLVRRFGFHAALLKPWRESGCRHLPNHTKLRAKLIQSSSGRRQRWVYNAADVHAIQAGMATAKLTLLETGDRVARTSDGRFISHDRIASLDNGKHASDSNGANGTPKRRRVGRQKGTCTTITRDIELLEEWQSGKWSTKTQLGEAKGINLDTLIRALGRAERSQKA